MLNSIENLLENIIFNEYSMSKYISTSDKVIIHRVNDTVGKYRPLVCHSRVGVMFPVCSIPNSDLVRNSMLREIKSISI